MSVLIKGLEMPETEYMDIRIYRDGTAVIALGKKPYYREFKAEPVRHGKWIVWDEILAGIYHTVSECSECGFTTDKMFREEMPYCPNCGARMYEDDG